MTVLRVLVADDESTARRRLCRLLGAMPDVQIVAECSNGAEVLAAVRADPDIQVAVLDIQMPELGGLDASALLRPARPYVIFVTAHQHHAIAAFELGATDYVLKPVSAERLQKAVQRAREAIAAQARSAGGGDPAAAAWRARLPIHTTRGVVLVDPDDITHAILDGELVTVCAREGRWVTELTLTELERRLDPARFRRVHRKAVLNLDHLRRLVPEATGGYRAELSDGARVPVSRQAARRLREELGL